MLFFSVLLTIKDLALSVPLTSAVVSVLRVTDTPDIVGAVYASIVTVTLFDAVRPRLSVTLPVIVIVPLDVMVPEVPLLAFIVDRVLPAESLTVIE